MAAARDKSASIWAVAVAGALTFHSAMAVVLWRADAPWLMVRERPVEIEVTERPPPPPELRPEAPPPPEPPPPPERPRIVARRPAPKEPTPTPPATPPPPNQEPPPEAPKNAPPVFGVSMSSVVAGDSAVAVPVGNTTMTRDRKPAPTPQAVQPYAGAGTQAFQPVAEAYIATRPRVIHEVNSADIYPQEAHDLGIEGNVLLSVGIDAAGKVVEVKVVQRAGHGFDEAAARALWKFRFSPALTSDGRAVPYRLRFNYLFEIHD